MAELRRALTPFGPFGRDLPASPDGLSAGFIPPRRMWPQRQGWFYGWTVAAAVCWVLTVGTGIVFYGQSVYLRELTTEQGFSVGAVSGATALFFLVTGLSGLAVARLLARVPASVVISGGAVIGGAALLLLGQVDRVWRRVRRVRRVRRPRCRVRVDRTAARKHGRDPMVRPAPLSGAGPRIDRPVAGRGRRDPARRRAAVRTHACLGRAVAGRRPGSRRRPSRVALRPRRPPGRGQGPDGGPPAAALRTRSKPQAQPTNSTVLRSLAPTASY